MEPTGRLGADDGYDVRGIEIAPVGSGVEERVWQIQCKREQEITPKKLAGYIDEMVPSGTTSPYGLLLTAPCDFSKRSRDLFKKELPRRGCAKRSSGVKPISKIFFLSLRTITYSTHISESRCEGQDLALFTSLACHWEITDRPNGLSSCTTSVPSPLTIAKSVFATKIVRTSNMNGS